MKIKSIHARWLQVPIPLLQELAVEQFTVRDGMVEISKPTWTEEHHSTRVC